MNSVQTDNKKKKYRIIKAVLAALLTLAEVFIAGAMISAYGEMCHERLTYSQWYEGSVQSFYRSIVLFLVNNLIFKHLFQNTISSLYCILRMFIWIIHRRTVWNRTQESNLRKTQLICVLSEISLTRRLNPIISIREINVIQVIFHDILFGILFLKFNRDKNLFHFSLPGNLVC